MNADKKNELLAIVQDMLSEKMNLIEGVRKINALRFAIGDPDNTVFYAIRAIDSETESYPLGTLRSYCDEDYLRHKDKELAEFLLIGRTDILKACRVILQVYGSESGPGVG
jgi:hypothetical protein